MICSEVFPGSVRTVTSTLAAASNWLWNFVISRATPTMFLRMGSGGYGVYIFFASMMVVSVPYIIYFLPETKAVPLEEMDRLFAPGMSSWGANKKVMAELQRERAGERGEPQFLRQDKDKAEVRHMEEAGEKV